jgi:hypothetical protein
VIGERLGNDEHRPLLGLREVGIARGDAVLGDDGGTVGLARVVHEEAPGGGVVRMEGQAQEALLAAGQHAGRDVQEDGRLGGSGAEHLDAPRLLHHEEPIRAVARMRDEDRALEIRRHGLEDDPRRPPRLQRARPQAREQGEALEGPSAVRSPDHVRP